MCGTDNDTVSQVHTHLQTHPAVHTAKQPEGLSHDKRTPKIKRLEKLHPGAAPRVQ